MLQEITVAGNTLSLHTVFDALGILILLIYILSQSKKYGEYLSTATSNKRNRTAVAFLLLLSMIILLLGLISVLNRAFADWFTRGNANYYGNLTAWLIGMTLLPIIFKVSPLKTMDLLSPGIPLCLFVAKLACFFHGCCSGYEMPGSWYFNQHTERYEFPVQLLESLIALGLFVFLRWYQKRNKITGSVFPVYLTLYAVSRFLTEFFRADLPHVLGTLTAYQILSAVYVLLGGVLLGAVWMYHRASSRGKKVSGANRRSTRRRK